MAQPIAPIGCYFCLCEVCNRMRCPKFNRRYHPTFCISMLMRGRCPVIKCDFFEHRQKKKVYRVVRRERKRDRLIERLESIESKLDDLSSKLENPSPTLR